jgi:Transcriptional regulatory protein, C terminal/Bacterial transcriptional activator domain
MTGLPGRTDVRVEFHLFGEVAACLDGQPVDLGHQRQRSVLAALLVDANRPVPTEELIDRVWGERPPNRVRESMYSYLSRLRGVLAGTGEASIAKQPAGYVLSVNPAAIDLHRFRALVAEARENDGRARELLGQALDLWQGEIADGVDTPWFTRLREKLAAERLAARLDLGDRNCGRTTRNRCCSTCPPSPNAIRWTNAWPANSCSRCTAPAGRPTRWPGTTVCAARWPPLSASIRLPRCANFTSGSSPRIQH